VVELKQEVATTREGVVLTRAKDLDACALQLDSDRTQLQEERDSLQTKLDATEGQAKKLKEVSASLSTAEGEVTLLKESIATLQIELSEATKLRQRRADHMRSVNAQRSKELVALVADMESLFPRLGLNPLPALVVPEDDDGEALAAHLRLMFTAFVKMEPLISDLIAKDSANLLRSAGRRIFYHLQRLGISVDFQELVRSAPKAEDLVKIDGGVATEKNI
jgi:septal ring factor EnvC (AmiA/AmiB activator)